MKIILLAAFLLISFTDSGGTLYKAADIRGNEVIIGAGNEPAIIIMFHGIACKECFHKIDTALNKINVPLKKIVLLNGAKRNIIRKKEEIKRARQYFSKKEYEFLFDIEDDQDSGKNIQTGLLSKYKVEIAPAVLIITRKKTQFYRQKELFKDNTVAADLELLFRKHLKK
ncbi:MAG: hypothetical protein ACLFR2_07630 [Candidatus Kapaibacterium sp.]